MNRIKKNSGFTLLEALVAAMLIGLAIAALAASSGAFTAYNAAGVDISTAEFLIEEIRELTAPLPVTEPGWTPVAGAALGPNSGETLATYDDVDDFHLRTYNPPIDAGRTAMPEFSAFTQQIMIRNVTAADLTQQAQSHSTVFYQVTVTISKNGTPISSSSWIRARY